MDVSDQIRTKRLQPRTTAAVVLQLGDSGCRELAIPLYGAGGDEAMGMVVCADVVSVTQTRLPLVEAQPVAVAFTMMVRLAVPLIGWLMVVTFMWMGLLAIVFVGEV